MKKIIQTETLPIKEKLNYRHEVIDHQLAYAAKSMLAHAYDRSQFLGERKVMMQEWVGYLDNIT